MKGIMGCLSRRVSWRASAQRCDCGGYWFPHRRGGGACDYSRRRDYHLALRAGCSRDEALRLLPDGCGRDRS